MGLQAVRTGALRRASALLLIALATACSKGEVERPVSALLVTLDTTRADALGCYGREPAVTPQLDRLAREGTLYLRAYTTAPITLPAHASMFTGLNPPRSTVRHNALRPLPQAAETLAELARAAGHQTAAFVAAVVLSDVFGLDQGFDVYDEPVPARGAVSTHFDERPAGAVIDAALGWLAQRDRERPFFLWVHLFDPHAPYAPPPEFRTGELARDPYLGEVAYVDRELGRLFDAMRAEGLFEHTVVLVVGDHGEAFGEHGELSHGVYCYESTLRVPFILRRPGGTGGGRRSDAVVSVTDVHPTLVEALRLPQDFPEPIDGISLYLVDPPPERGLYFESYYGWHAYGWSPLAGWLDARGKYLHSSTPQFFDIAADPAEARDLIGERDLRPYLEAIGRAAALPTLPRDTRAGVDAELQERIRGLGYAGVSEADEEEPHPLARTGLPSPAQRSEQHRALMEATYLLNHGDHAAAGARLDSVLAVEPDNAEALEMASVCRIQTQRFAEALPLLQRIISLGRARATTHYNMAISLQQLARNDEAVVAYQRAFELAPREQRVLAGLVQLLRAEGRLAEAAVYEDALGKLGEQ